MALVVKEWKASYTPDENGTYIKLVGREEGLLSWFLALLKIDATTSVEIKENVVLFSEGSLEGSEIRVIPIASVCSTYYGYKKPWKEALVLGLVLLPVFGIGLIIGPLYYFLNKTMSVGIVENSGWAGGFAFKRSVIEGKNIDEKGAYQIIDIIRTIIEKKS